MRVFLLSKKGVIALIRWLMFGVLAYLMFQKGEVGVTSLSGLILLLYLSSNILLSLTPEERFYSWRLDYWIVVLDAALVFGAIYILGDPDLYYAYFLSLLIAALGKDIRASLFVAIASSLLYGLLYFRARPNAELLDPGLLIRFPFFYLAALSASFLAQESEVAERRRQKTQFLLRLSEEINASSDWGHIEEILERALKEQTHVSGTALLLWDSQAGCWSLKKGLDIVGNPPVSGWVISPQELGPEVREALWERREPFYLPAMPEGSPRIGLDESVQSLSLLPVNSEGEPVALLVVGSDRLDAFSPEEREVFSIMASLLGAAWRRIRLIRDLRLNLEELQSLVHIGKLTSSSLKVREVLNEAMERTKEVMGVEACSLLLLDENTGELYFEVALGEKGEDVKIIRIPPGKGIAGWVAQEGKPILMSDARKDVRFYQTVDEKTGFVTRSLMAVPLIARGRSLGVMEAINKKDGQEFRDRDLEFFQALASQVAIALENTRLYSNLEKKAKETETLYGRMAQEMNRVEAILSSMTEAVIVVDSEGKVTEANQAAQRVFDLFGGFAYGRGFPNHEPWSNLQRIFEATLRGGVSISEKLTVPGEDSQTFQAHTALIRGPGREVTGALAVLEDITEIERLNKMKSEFVSHVSHELRTPLTSIKGAARLLDRPQIGELNDKQRRLLRIIDDEGTRLTGLIDDLLELSRLESGLVRMKKEPESLREIARECIESLKSVADEKGLTLELLMSVDLPRILMDREQIRKVLANLLSNAIKFTPSGGKVQVAGRAVYSSGLEGETRSILNHLEVRVIDTGIGIPPSHLGKVFEKFHMVDSSLTREIPGTGLGLSICKQIVEAHGGRIWAESTVGKGSCFTFVLPPEVRPE